MNRPSLRPPVQAIPCSALLAIVLLAAGCAPKAITLKKIGDSCSLSLECGSDDCSSPDGGVCTKKCAQQADCPEGFDCGLAQRSDGELGGLGPSCYKANWTSPATGGYGTACGDYSPDYTTGIACDGKAANPCASGFTCLGRTKCDATATCTKMCANDSECPPSLYCAVEYTSTTCTSNSDCGAGFTCVDPGAGSGKVCTASWCRPRLQCAPCGTTDQCGVGYHCAIDVNGGHYCGLDCTSDDNCPYAVQDSSSFMSCQDAGIGGGVKVCRPEQGACHGPSAVMGVANNGTCAWCRGGIPSDCPNGFCIELETEEHYCTQPCTAQVSNGNTLTVTGEDTCPDGLHCYIQAIAMTCPATCQGSGFCQADTFSETAAATCYP